MRQRETGGSGMTRTAGAPRCLVGNRLITEIWLSSEMAIVVPLFPS